VSIRVPAVSFVRAGRVPPQAERSAFPELAPDLAVEVLSRWEHDHPGAVLQKVGQYLDAGVRVVWVIDPQARSVVVYQADHGPVPTSVLDDDQAVLEAPERWVGVRLQHDAGRALHAIRRTAGLTWSGQGTDVGVRAGVLDRPQLWSTSQRRRSLRVYR
jgi:Putative restriction endonuclease